VYCGLHHSVVIEIHIFLNLFTPEILVDSD
jgi:hypothetical protein